MGDYRWIGTGGSVQVDQYRWVNTYTRLLTFGRNEILHNILVNHGPLSTTMQAPGFLFNQLSHLCEGHTLVYSSHSKTVQNLEKRGLRSGELGNSHALQAVLRGP